MKSSTLIAFITTNLLLAGIYFYHIPGQKIEKARAQITKKDSTIATRTNITFIMGADKPGAENTYYQSATQYYRLNPEHREEAVVTNCRSLTEVRDFLANTETDNCQPWGTIHIVVHGNQWSGIRTPVYKGGPRTTAATVLDAIHQNVFLPLPVDKADGNSMICLEACALGNDIALIEALSRAFGGNRGYQHRPKIVSPRHFVIYDAGKKEATDFRQYLAASWFTFCPSDSALYLPTLADQLQTAYPHENISWKDALKREQPRFPGDTYFHTFRVPVHWTITYPSAKDRPVFQDENAFLEWMESQQELTNILMKAGLPKKQFTWLYKYVEVAVPSGEKQPAIKVSGSCSVVCILKYLPDPAAGYADARYYCVR